MVSGFHSSIPGGQLRTGGSCLPWPEGSGSIWDGGGGEGEKKDGLPGLQPSAGTLLKDANQQVT